MKNISEGNDCLACGQEIDYEDTEHKCPDMKFSNESLALVDPFSYDYPYGRYFPFEKSSKSD